MRRVLAVLATVVLVALAPYAWRGLKRWAGALSLVLAFTNCGPVKVSTDATEVSKPTLTLRASPRMGLPPLQVLLVAEIAGDVNETFYCPTVRWKFPNDTEATETGDCVPFAQLEEYQRRWTRAVLIGSPGQWPFTVLLEKSGHVIARADVTVLVAGDLGNLIVGPTAIPAGVTQ